MQQTISARGYTSVLLVLNMKRFVCEEDRDRFELMRGSDAFAKALRTDWLHRAGQQDLFIPLQNDSRVLAADDAAPADKMTTEEVGYATGIFRSLMLERFVFPTYRVDKSRLEFSPQLESNFQFKVLFREALNHWDIYIRPSVNGFFILRLTQRYDVVPRPFLRLAKDVLRLQESLDIPSAQRRLILDRQKYQDNPALLDEKERSIQAFLQWLGADEEENNNQLQYYPVQWKLAMEVATRFVSSICGEIFLSDKEIICFKPPPPNPSVPLHDSYVIHHFDTVLAHPSMLATKPQKTIANTVQIPVSVQDIRQSPQLRRAFANIIEGTVLRVPVKETLPKGNEPTAYFPSPRWNLVDALVNDPSYNQASWNDELCLMSGRTTVIVPSLQSHNHELAVATVPGASLMVKYARYWGAIERMIEFIFEIRVLAQLIDSESYRFLGEIANTIEHSRLGLTEGDIVLDTAFRKQIVQAANLRRIVALVQSVSHPQLWSRAEYAIRKAEYLFAQLGVSETLEHVESNIASINSVVDHVDELYLADLSERANDKSTLLSIGLAAASLILTLLMLPSFWIDGIGIINNDFLPLSSAGGAAIWLILVAGTISGFILIALALILIYAAWQRRDLVVEMFRKLFNGRHKPE